MTKRVHRSFPASDVLSLALALGALPPLTAAASGCEQPARAQQGGGGAGGPGGPRSVRLERSDDALVEGESCTRTDDCPRTARCIDGRCLPTARTYQGEVLAERGLRALALGRFQDGAEAFRNAQRAYQERRIPVPAQVVCGLARAMIALNDRGATAPGAADARESTARALADCLATAAPGSAQADQALSSLAGLAERGLDPTALDRPDAALMTGRDPRPTAENTRVRLTMSGTGTGEGLRLFRELVNGEPIKREITRCFLQWWESSRQNADQGQIRVAYSRAVDDYDELGAPRLTVTAADIAPSAAGDAGSGQLHWLQCSAVAIQEAAGAIRWPGRAERWVEPIFVTVGPM